MLKWILSALCFLAFLIPARAGGNKQSGFAAELELLTGESSKLGKDETIWRYRDLARRYADHPEVAKVYLEIASYYPYDDPEGAKSLEAAAAHATAGSDLWVRAKLQLFNEYKLMDPKRAKEILEEIGPNVRGDLLNAGRVAYAFQEYYTYRKDYVEAEKWCRKVLSSKLPEDDVRASQFNMIRVQSADVFIKEIDCMANPHKKGHPHRNFEQTGGRIRVSPNKGRKGDRGN